MCSEHSAWVNLCPHFEGVESVIVVEERVHSSGYKYLYLVINTKFLKLEMKTSLQLAHKV